MTVQTFADVFDDLYFSVTSQRGKGTKFERLLKRYLQVKPKYADQFSQVWLWQEWPDRNGLVDTGIDLVAEDRYTGELVAIQAKFYDPAKALCHPERKVNKSVGQSPDPTACESRCTNIARTDKHIERIQRMIEESKREAESEAVPLPLGERSKQRVSLLEALVMVHDETEVEL